MKQLKDLNVKIFADTANYEELKQICLLDGIQGITTNPTLMKKAGIKDYESFARDVLNICGNKAVSFEVFSDDFDEMEQQALTIASWGENVYVKIPVINTKKQFAGRLIESLSRQGVQVNVTAVFTQEQIDQVIQNLNIGTKAIISVFAGRIADAGIDPEPVIIQTLAKVKNYKNIEVLWASSRESFNIIQANRIGCDIITVSYDLLKKTKNFNKDLNQYSLETVEMFYNDAVASGYSINQLAKV